MGLLESDQIRGDERNVKDLFSDWSHMSLKEDMMNQLREVWSKKFESSMYQDTDNDMLDNSFGEVADDSLPIKLIDYKAWCKITYNFGIIGPEILFFCQENGIINHFQMPDLEPISISIR